MECGLLFANSLFDLLKLSLLCVNTCFDWLKFDFLFFDAFFDLSLTPFDSVNPFFKSADLNFEVFTLGIRDGLDLGLHRFEFILHHFLLVLEFSTPVVTVNLV